VRLDDGHRPAAEEEGAIATARPSALVPVRVEVSGLTKDFGPVRAVSDLAFTVEPGSVTGFLGPNGAGKTTTLRMMLGLVRPDAGTATFGGVPYGELPDPVRTVGAVLETAFHPARSGRNHLRVYCQAAGLPGQRADEVLAQVGLTDAGSRRAGGYSLGMRQRLALATALLGDPAVLVLDEPANGLDPEGIQWLRGFLRYMAHEEGRTVLVSSHLLSEMQALADDVVIVAAGRLVRQGAVTDVLASMSGGDRVKVRTPEPEKLTAALHGTGVAVTTDGAGMLLVSGATATSVGDTALAAGVAVHHLTAEQPDLEDVFLELTQGKATIR
jgi:ABC-2 type transport system ATP-binding protein